MTMRFLGSKMHKYYARVNTPASHISKFYGLPRLSKLDWLDFEGFAGNLVPEEIWSKVGFLEAVRGRYPESLAIIMRLDPGTAYLWHKDVDRTFTINMLLHRNGHSHTVFGEDQTEFTSKITELDYEPEYLYIFNTQEKHEVYNLDEYRYLFTMKIITEDSYEDILRWAGDEGWLD